MKTTVRLYGHLGREFGREFRFDIKTPAEAIKALRVNCPGFLLHLEKHSNPGYKLVVGGQALQKEEEIGYPWGKGVIRVVPITAGSGSKEIFQIFTGVALAAFGYFNPGTFLATKIAQAVTGFGVSMAFGGISSLISPPPKTIEPAERPDNKPGFSFDGPVNTTAQGNAVPVGYGRLIVGSQVISAGFSVDELQP